MVYGKNLTKIGGGYTLIMENKVENQTTQNSRLGILDKVRKAISAAMMAGMLASPMAAHEMKNKTTYNEPTCVERSAEQEQNHYQDGDLEVNYNEAKKLLLDIISSKLIRYDFSVEFNENMSTYDQYKQTSVIEAEITDYINRIMNVSRGLYNNAESTGFNRDFRDAVEVIEGLILDGQVREVNTTYEVSMLNKAYEFSEDQNAGQFARDALFDLNTHISARNVKEASIYSRIYDMGVNPSVEEQHLFKDNILKNVEKIGDVLECEGLGNRMALETFVLLNSSIRATNYMINKLEELNGIDFSKINLRPHKIVNQQVDQEMSR